MATVIRAELSVSNKYWIDKHRHYELKHFCLQYPAWKEMYRACDKRSIGSSLNRDKSGSYIHSDPTSNQAIRRAHYAERIEMIERAARGSDEDLHQYILTAVTEGLSFNQLKSRFDIPCSRDTYYDRYRRFFWLLDKSRN